MPTLSEYQKLGNDVVLPKVYDNILTTNEVIPWLEFMSFSGNSLKYNRENLLPTSVTHVVGDDWVDSEPTFTQKNTSLVTVGTQSPLDRFASQTIDNVTSQQEKLMNSMMKSVFRKVTQLMITGDPGTVSSEFEGLTSLLLGETRFMAMDDGNVDGPGTAETELTMDRLDAMIDLVEGGKPQILMMNKTMRRKLSTLSRNAGGGVLMNTISEFGHQVSQYDGIPIVINDFITNAEIYEDSGTWGSSTATSIFALNMGEERQGYTIIHNGEVIFPDVQDLGIKENKNENLFRIVVYLAAVTFSAKYVAALGGIDSAV